MPDPTAIDRALCCGPTCHRGTDATGPCVASTYGAGVRLRVQAAGYIILSAVDHDRRITELLEANNRQVERRRRLIDALRKLACLGNGDTPGNSAGNVIALAALAGDQAIEKSDG